MKRKMAAALAALALAVIGVIVAQPATAAGGTTYYVSNAAGCSDSGSGTSTAAPFCTFTPLNAHGPFQPGDSILLARGSSWNQQLTLTGSGTASSPITVDAYGSGSRPKISRNGAVDDRGIKLVNGDFWRIANLEISNAAAGILVFFSSFGHEGLSFSDIYVHHIRGLLYYRANGAGDEVPSAIADNVRNSSGIQVTGTYSSFTASQYLAKDLRFDRIEGDHNLNTIGIDAIQPGHEVDVQLGGSGTGGANLFQNVVINHLSSHDDDWVCSEAMRLFTAKHVVVMNSDFRNETPCGIGSGTTTVILGHLEDATIVNSMFTNNLSTNSNDENALDFEIANTQVRARNNLMANTPGSALSFLLLGRPGDYSNGHEVSGNVFSNNGYAPKHHPGAILALNSPKVTTITGSINDNISVNPIMFVDEAAPGGFKDMTTANNRLIDAGSGSVSFAASDFSSAQGASLWRYQRNENGVYSDLDYSAVGDRWTPAGQATPEITRFDMHPGTTSTSWAARAWTAPVDGKVSLRGRILKSDNTGLGNGVVARITRNGQTIWPASGIQTVAAGDEYDGVGYALDDVAVTAGDILRFEIGSNGDSAHDKTSWTPSVTYTSASRSYSWGFLAGRETGWAVQGATSSTAYGTSLAGLNVTSTTTDPRLESPAGLQINAATQKTVTVRMSNATASTVGKIYFRRSTDSVWSEARSTSFTVAPNSGLVSYTINVGANSEWTGEIDQLRVDPIEAPGNVIVDDIAVSGPSSATLNRLRDGGFERPSVNGYVYSPAGTAWVYSPTAGVQRTLSAFTSTGAFAGLSSYDQQSAFVQGTGSVAQTTWMGAGTRTLTFLLAQRTNHGGPQNLDVYVDGVKVNAGPLAPPTSGFATKAVTFPVTAAGDHTVELRGTNPGDNTVFLDQVALR